MSPLDQKTEHSSPHSQRKCGDLECPRSPLEILTWPNNPVETQPQIPNKEKAQDKEDGSTSRKGLERTKVLMLRNLIRDVSEQDIVDIIKASTQCSTTNLKVYLAILNGFAFIEFDSVADCHRAFKILTKFPLVIDGRKVSAVLSKRSHVVTVSEQLQQHKVLLVTILNLKSRVRVSELYNVFSRVGENAVQKIFIFAENTSSVRAFVEFANCEMAKLAINWFDNENLRDGSNTMHMEPSTIKSLDITMNHRNAWDYTVDPNGYQEETEPEEKRGKIMLISSTYGDPVEWEAAKPKLFKDPDIRRIFKNHKMPILKSNDPMTDRVIMVWGFPKEFLTVRNCFNVFSTCGNIEKINIIRKHDDDRAESIVMVQYSDRAYVLIAMFYLRGRALKADQPPLRIFLSNSSEIVSYLPSSQSMSFKQREQRFPSKEDRYLRHACFPTRMVFFSPVPAEMTSERLIQECETRLGLTLDAPEVSVIQNTDGPSKVRSFLVRMASVDEAVACVAICHDMVFESPTQVKVSFSRNKTFKGTRQANSNHNI